MDATERMLFDLQTISRIPRGAKITTSRDFIGIEDETMLQPVYRAWRGENRLKAIHAIVQLVDNLILVSELLLESRFLHGGITTDSPTDEFLSRTDQLKRICSGLSAANVGIKNIMSTYAKDTNVIARLRPAVHAICVQVKKITDGLDQLGVHITPSHEWV